MRWCCRRAEPVESLSRAFREPIESLSEAYRETIESLSRAYREPIESLSRAESPAATATPRSRRPPRKGSGCRQACQNACCACMQSRPGVQAAFFRMLYSVSSSSSTHERWECTYVADTPSVTARCRSFQEISLHDK